MPTIADHCGTLPVAAFAPGEALLVEGGRTGRFYVLIDGAAFLEQHPEVSAALARLLAQRLHGVTTYLVDMKQQFEDHASHLGMVDEILEALVHDHPRDFTPGSDREPEM